MQTYRVLFLSLLALFLWPLVAHAGAAQVLDQVATPAIAVGATLVGLAAVWVLRKLAAKFHWQITSQQMGMWEQLAEQAVMRAAAHARAMSTKSGVVQPTPEELINLATGWLAQAAEAMGLPAKDADGVKGLVMTVTHRIWQTHRGGSPI